jgi:hypothetical protein
MSLRPLLLALSLVSTACVLSGRRATTSAEPDRSGASDPPSATLLATQLANDAHLDDVGFALLKSAGARCPSAKPRAGFRFANRPAYTRMWQPFAAELGISDTVRVLSVAKGGGAESAGLRAGDRIVSLDGVPATPGDRVVSALRSHAAKSADGGARTLPATVRRDGRELSLSMPLDSVCALAFMSWRDDGPDAWSGDETIAVTTGMLAFAASDDELAILLAHEIAHRIVREGRPRGKMDAVLDATGDFATSAIGYATDDRWAQMKRDRPTEPTSREDERRADELTVEILRRAGRPVTGLREFWRRLLVPDPARMPYVRAHELSAERLFRLDELSRSVPSRGAPER